MADDFDTSRASRDHKELLSEIRSIRDELTDDVINYNWERIPRSDSDVRSTRADMRRYLERARVRLDDVMRRL